MTPTQIRMDRFYEADADDNIWSFTHDTLPEVGEDEITVRLDWLSVDPAMRGWTTNKRSYMPPVQPGEIMRGFGCGEVIESNNKHFAVGDWVAGFTGMQTHAVLNPGMLQKVDTSNTPAQYYLSGLGWTGYTAYFGMLDIGNPHAGQTVVVSAASGAVGSIASQLARDAGARVIGIAGGPDKTRFLLEELKLDAAIDYKNDDVVAALKETAPDGIDIFFDNVGGDILDAVLMQMNYQGTVVICGGISQYGDMKDASGPKEYLQLVMQSLRMQGFTMRDYLARIPEALAHLNQAHKQGKLVFREHIIEGIENFPAAARMLYSGENRGKLLLKIEH